MNQNLTLPLLWVYSSPGLAGQSVHAGESSPGKILPGQSLGGKSPGGGSPGGDSAFPSRKKRSTNSSDEKPPPVDVFLNPMMQMEKGLITEFMKNTTRHLFDPPLPPSSFPHLFHLLRRTNLPCFPLDQNQTHMILRYRYQQQIVNISHNLWAPYLISKI